MTETGRATAVAHPIQGIVKYHGLRDFAHRIPFHASVSVCTAPTHTRTTLAVLDGGTEDVASVDGEPAKDRVMERILDVVDAVRTRTGDDRPFRMASDNSFPSRVGLGSSASGFAALAVAAAEAYGLEADPERLSAIARLGAGSAARSVTGWFSEWAPPAEGREDDMDASVSHLLPGGDQTDMRIIVPLVRSDEPTEGVHREVLTSPFFQARLDYIDGALSAVRQAVAAHDIAAIGAIAERDTLNLHAITMTAEPPRITWRPQTLAVMHRVRALRDEGTPCWFSIDTGATPYVNTTSEHEDAVAKAMGEVDGIDEVLRLTVGPAAHVVRDHLF